MKTKKILLWVPFITKLKTPCNLIYFQDSVQSGLDLQRYIHEEIQKSKEDSEFSASEPQAEIFEDSTNDIAEPVFSIVEEFNKPKQPIYFDVPIKIEENGEGFDPPTEIRYK